MWELNCCMKNTRMGLSLSEFIAFAALYRFVMCLDYPELTIVNYIFSFRSEVPT